MTKVKKLLKKAFTLVELVVVVAIIAILSGVSVAAYVGITDRANKAADQDVVAQLNLQLAAQESIEGKNKTCFDAIKDAYEVGLNLEELKPNTKNCEYVWDSKTDRFGIVNDEDETIAEDSTRKLSEDKFLIYRLSSSYPTSSQYSIYLRAGANVTSIDNVFTNFDAGFNENIASITVTGKESGRTINVRTASLATTVNINSAHTINVNHYGNAGFVNVTDLDGKYNEYGYIGRLTATDGAIAIQNGATVNYLNATAASKALQAEIYGNDGKEIGASFTPESALTVTGCLHDGDIDKVIDMGGPFNVCRKCGSTLGNFIDVQTKTVDTDTNVYYQTLFTKRALVDNEGKAQAISAQSYKYDGTADLSSTGSTNKSSVGTRVMSTINSLSIEQKLCSHEKLKYTELDNNLHEVLCSNCGYTFKEPHKMDLQQCELCGEKEHNWEAYFDTDGTTFMGLRCTKHNEDTCHSMTRILNASNKNAFGRCGHEIALISNVKTAKMDKDYLSDIKDANETFGITLIKPLSATTTFTYGSYDCFYQTTDGSFVNRISFPEGLTNLTDVSLFSNLETIDFPSTLKMVNKGACSNLTKLRYLVFPSGLTMLGKGNGFNNAATVNSWTGLFQGCINLKSVNIPSTVNQIDVKCFYGCSSLSGEIRFSNTLHYIGELAFYGCSSLEKIIIENKTGVSKGFQGLRPSSLSGTEHVKYEFEGTVAQWNTMLDNSTDGRDYGLRSTWDRSLYNAIDVQCTDGVGELLVKKI